MGGASNSLESTFEEKREEYGSFGVSQYRASGIMQYALQKVSVKGRFFERLTVGWKPGGMLSGNIINMRLTHGVRLF
ncbi:MAG: hypothetical protein QXY01_06235 [Candidatus Bathyarchaeia archaeon]